MTGAGVLVQDALFATLDPTTRRATTFAVTEEITSTPNDCAANARRMISRPNTTPAIGALNVAEIPPAAPHATIRVSRPDGTRSACPIEEPSADPICTIGPSRPTEPPVPMHTADARAFTPATRAGMRPPRRATASITSGTPWPRASGAKRCTRGP